MNDVEVILTKSFKNIRDYIDGIELVSENVDELIILNEVLRHILIGISDLQELNKF